ncbi:hypothetical protein [Flavobacterium sp.]|uniref:hypothetical protein n=1 Tax=Flavobacterium sp. TaxID=239 RepID=UPI003A8EFC5D
METNKSKNPESDISPTKRLEKIGLPIYMLTDAEGYECKLRYSNYFDVFIVIEDLIEISLHTLYNSESENSGFVRHPTRHLVSVLELIKQLLPGDTGQTLKELNDYLNAKKEELNKKLDSNPTK